MADISASFTQHHHSDFYLDKGQGHIFLNLQDFVDLSSLKNLSDFLNKAILLNCSQQLYLVLVLSK